MGVAELRERGRQAAHGRELGWVGRAGLVAHAVIYSLVALLALHVAFGDWSQGTPGKDGALKLVAEQPFGRGLLVLLAVGFAAYGLWRLAQGFFDRKGKGDEAPALAVRAGYVAVGIWFGLLAVLTFNKALSDSNGGTGPSERETASGVFGLPLGRELVFAAGVGFLAGACFQVYKPLAGKLEKALGGGAGYEGSRAALAVGTFGHVARGVVFAIIGIFLCKAAWEFDASETRGLDGALLALVQQSHGALLLGAVAVGLAAYAAWDLVLARYGRV